MLDAERSPQHSRPAEFLVFRANDPANRRTQPLEARVKPECGHLYPGVDPNTWYQVVQEGEYKDDMEGLWIQVTDWVTYVLAKHFDFQARPNVH